MGFRTVADVFFYICEVRRQTGSYPLTIRITRENLKDLLHHVETFGIHGINPEGAMKLFDIPIERTEEE